MIMMMMMMMMMARRKCVLTEKIDVVSDAVLRRALINADVTFT